MTNLPDEILSAVRQSAPVPFRADSYVAMLEPEPGEIEQRVFSCIACVDEQHTTGNFVRIGGMHFETFDANPAMPMCHVASPISSPKDVLPVGKWLARATSPLDDGTDALYLKGQFVPPDIFPNRTEFSDFADAVYRLYLHRFMRAFSIAGDGIPGQVRTWKQNGLTGLYFNESELFECSPVLLPAVRRAHMLPPAQASREIHQALQDYEPFKRACAEGILTHAMAQRAERMLVQMCERFAANVFEVGMLGSPEGDEVAVKTPDWKRIESAAPTKPAEKPAATAPATTAEPATAEPAPVAASADEPAKETAYQSALRAMVKAGAISDAIDVPQARAAAAWRQLSEIMWRMGYATDRLFRIDASAVEACCGSDSYDQDRPAEDVVLRHVRLAIAMTDDLGANLAAMQEALEMAGASGGGEEGEPVSQDPEKQIEEPAEAGAEATIAAAATLLTGFAAEGRVFSKENLSELEGLLEKISSLIGKAKKKGGMKKDAEASGQPPLYGNLLRAVRDSITGGATA